MILTRFLSKNPASPHQTPFRANSYKRTMSFSKSSNENDQLFTYTSGRWLWNERQQLDARYRRFDVESLRKVACDALGSTRCISFEKIGEGNYNKVFRLVMQDGQKVVAKIPNPNAGPAEHTTASEVATLEFARTILNLPVPKVLAWSATSQNPVESEYILMEEARGLRLHDVWQISELRAKRDLVREIVEIEKKMLSVSFDTIGSLYFKNSGFSDCRPAKATAASQDLEDSIASRFSIGPIVRREFWEKERSEMHQYHGPWRSAKQYLESIARREIDWIKRYADPMKVIINPWLYTSSEQNSPDAHISSLRKFISVIPDIVPRDPDLVSPRFWHPDFHAGNIYVDENGKISSIIDWQAAWISPLYIGANPPMVLDYAVEMMMKLPENFKQLDEGTKDRLRYQVAQSILIHAYETRTAKENPLMHKMMRYPQGKTLKQLEAFANATWDNCLYPFQECLIRVEREWRDFGSDKPCPYHFSDEEIRRHQEQSIAFNENQDFWESIGNIVTDEGYTSAENFSKGIDIFQRLRESGLKTLYGEEREEFEKQTRWLLDIST